MEEYSVPVGVRNDYGYTEILIVSFIPEARKKKLPISFTGAFCALFSCCLSLFLSTQCGSSASLPLHVRNLQKARSK